MTGPTTGPTSGPSPDERPLAACLADFWQGDFTVHFHPNAAPEPGDAGFPASMGPSGITAHGRDLATHLAPLYRRLTAGE